jgi:hypothetical protein
MLAMPFDSDWLLFGGFLLFAAIAAIVGVLQAAKRRKALAEWASNNGYSFREARDHSFDTRYSQFDCLRRGDNRYAFNILQGVAESDAGAKTILAFDYHYQTYSRDNKGRRKTHHHYFSAVIIAVNLPLRPLLIRPEGVFDKLAAFFGKEDINFESAEFSRKFHVSAPDRQWAFDVIHQGTMEFLLAQPRFSIEMEGPGVIVWKGGRLCVGNIEAAIAVGSGILARLPRYLLNELKGVGT